MTPAEQAAFDGLLNQVRALAARVEALEQSGAQVQPRRMVDIKALAAEIHQKGRQRSDTRRG